METLLQDIRFGGRMLLKNRGFTLVAIVALTLGIGANTAIFSLVNGVLLRPLPYPNSERIVSFQGRNPSQGINASNISFPDFVEWSKQSDLFSGSAAFYTGNSNLAADNAEPERVPRAGVTSEFFSVLAVQPALGRTFRAEEDQPNNVSVVLLSDGLWKRRFGSDPNIVGQQISVGAKPVTVIGVMPPGFDFPEQSQIWTTSAVNPNEEPRDNRSFSAIARLRDGVELSHAQAKSAPSMRASRSTFPTPAKAGMRAFPSCVINSCAKRGRLCSPCSARSDSSSSLPAQTWPIFFSRGPPAGKRKSPFAPPWGRAAPESLGKCLPKAFCFPRSGARLAFSSVSG